MSFEKLMGELQELHGAQETLSKALPADDGKDEDKVQAAAAEGGSDETGAAAEAGGANEGEGEGGEPVMKSLKVTMADGTEAEAIDGTEMIKSLQARIEKGETDTIAAVSAAMTIIKGQNDMIKSLSDRVAKLGNQGAGRKAVVSMTQKPTPGEGVLAKSEPVGVSTETFFAKALDAQRAGRITGTDIAIAEASINRGEKIPGHILSAVLS